MDFWIVVELIGDKRKMTSDLLEENQDLRKQVEELKVQIEKMADCSNCKHWHYSTRLLAYFCDCSDMISDSIDSRTYEHCDKWELE